MYVLLLCTSQVFRPFRTSLFNFPKNTECSLNCMIPDCAVLSSLHFISRANIIFLANFFPYVLF
jgi:hypothetical protein